MKSFSLWNSAPALLYALAYLFGTLFALCSAWALLPFLLLIATKPQQMPILVALFLLPMPLTEHAYQQVDEGRFKISSYDYNYTWVYRGKLGARQCTITSKKRLAADCHYHVKGKWKSETFFIANEITPIAKSFSLAKWRHEKKRSITHFLKNHLQSERATNFYAGLLTGKLDDDEMRKEFAEVGLLHLLAISGFHFGVIIFLLHTCLKWILPRKVELILVICLMSFYALFIGNTPSLFRAWIFMMIYLGGQLMEKKSCALNVLGSALFISVLLNPYAVRSIGFQLSFLATGGLLLFYGPVEKGLRWLFPKPMLFTLFKQHPLIQVGYLLTAFFRELFAVTLAVHLVLLPLLLYQFHVLYPIGLIFNIFFPFLTAVALALLPIYPVADTYTHLILKLTERSYTPIYIEDMSIGWMTLSVSLICLGGVCIEERRLFLRRQSLGF